MAIADRQDTLLVLSCIAIMLKDFYFYQYLLCHPVKMTKTPTLSKLNELFTSLKKRTSSGCNGFFLERGTHCSHSIDSIVPVK